MGVIALLTDFGGRDHYVAQMKGVLLSGCPGATILDITHEVEKFNIRAGSFILAAAAKYTPKGTVHLAVVDPGVGSERRPIVFHSTDALFVGPDNGLMAAAAELRGLEEAYLIDVEALGLRNVSSVFHGRDIFAPVACKLHNGTPPDEIGPRITDYVKSSLTAAKPEDGSIRGEVVYVDGFGNVITNVSAEQLEQLGIKWGGKLVARLGGRAMAMKFLRAYAEARPGVLAALVGSHGFLEIGMNRASASKRLRVKSGDPLRIMVR